MARTLALIANGIVDNVILGHPENYWEAIDITVMDPRPGIGWAYDGDQFTAPEIVPVPPPSRITRLAFRNRFTTTELVALDLASIDDPAAAAPQRQLAASLRVMQANLQAATFIDLQRPDTRAGVQQLEAAGLLAAGRALDILDAPMQPVEAWQE